MSAAPPLLLIEGDASEEEIAALVAVLQGIAAGQAEPEREPVSEWSAHHRKVRAWSPSGPGGWRSSALPR
ncbi:MAG TPA: acyl-CoA carboxylase subunit epsilon [Nocardioidaceae bacterium]|nr:acyl-CoA carboxylase subunit epsilon [Nocardioidaceae bacterium]